MQKTPVPPNGGDRFSTQKFKHHKNSNSVLTAQGLNIGQKKKTQ